MVLKVVVLSVWTMNFLPGEAPSCNSIRRPKVARGKSLSGFLWCPDGCAAEICKKSPGDRGIRGRGRQDLLGKSYWAGRPKPVPVSVGPSNGHWAVQLRLTTPHCQVPTNNWESHTQLGM
jgi:hypothetical protein